jgi:hypothetical protein
MPSITELNERRRAYEEAHPNHCGRCGLPPSRCFHNNPEVRARFHNAITADGSGGYIRELRDVYENTLFQMPLDELLDLPSPPRPWMGEILVRVLQHHERVASGEFFEPFAAQELKGFTITEGMKLSGNCNQTGEIEQPEGERPCRWTLLMSDDD